MFSDLVNAILTRSRDEAAVRVGSSQPNRTITEYN